jgi:Hypoxia induced protein conserved region
MAMAKNQDDAPVIISEDDARGGVTGHHVRYVLAFGLAGIIIAFLAIGAYFGYGALTQVVSKIFAAEGMLWQRLISYAVSLALAVIVAVLLLGLWNMVWGRSENASQTFMRWRVVLQFIAICLVMVALYLVGRH